METPPNNEPKRRIDPDWTPPPGYHRPGGGEVEILRTVIYKNDPEKDVATDIYRSSKNGSQEDEYYFFRDITIGAKNNKHQLRITFQSLEIEDNEKLLHLLHKNMKP